MTETKCSRLSYAMSNSSVFKPHPKVLRWLIDWQVNVCRRVGSRASLRVASVMNRRHRHCLLAAGHFNTRHNIAVRPHRPRNHHHHYHQNHRPSDHRPSTSRVPAATSTSALKTTMVGLGYTRAPTVVVNRQRDVFTCVYSCDFGWLHTSWAISQRVNQWIVYRVPTVPLYLYGKPF